jgi:hypothetical protein
MRLYQLVYSVLNTLAPTKTIFLSSHQTRHILTRLWTDHRSLRHEMHITMSASIQAIKVLAIYGCWSSQRCYACWRWSRCRHRCNNYSAIAERVLGIPGGGRDNPLMGCVPHVMQYRMVSFNHISAFDITRAPFTKHPGALKYGMPVLGDPGSFLYISQKIWNGVRDKANSSYHFFLCNAKIDRLSLL